MEIAQRLLNKLETNAGKIGFVGGYIGTWQAVAQAEGKSLWEVLWARHYNALVKMNFKNAVTSLVPRIMNDPNWGTMVTFGTQGAILGLFLKEIGIDARLTRLGSALVKGGSSMAMAGVMASFIGGLSEASGGSEVPYPEEEMAQASKISVFNGVYD